VCRRHWNAAASTKGLWNSAGGSLSYDSKSAEKGKESREKVPSMRFMTLDEHLFEEITCAIAAKVCRSIFQRQVSVRQQSYKKTWASSFPPVP
jgi:hypothetical protein